MVSDPRKGQLDRRGRLVTFGKERGMHRLVCFKQPPFLTGLNLTSTQGKLWLRIKTKN